MEKLVCLVLLVLVSVVKADEASHKYEIGEHVILWVNKVGPYHNPQETYRFHSLPYCVPDTPPAGRQHAVKWDGLGSVLEGNDLSDSRIPLSFRKNVDHQVLCEKTLTAEEANQFTYAIDNRYWYQLYMGEFSLQFFEFAVELLCFFKMIYLSGEWLESQCKLEMIQRIRARSLKFCSLIRASAFLTTRIESLKSTLQPTIESKSLLEQKLLSPFLLYGFQQSNHLNQDLNDIWIQISSSIRYQVTLSHIRLTLHL
jgi:hypothetical protein